MVSDYLRLAPDLGSELKLAFSSAQTNRGGKRGGAEGAEKRQTLNMQTVKKDKVVTNWNVWSESGYVYILKRWEPFPRKYFTKASTDLSSEQINYKQ